MKCERCNERDATIHISKLEAGIKTMLNICEQCATQEGILYSFKPMVVELKKIPKKCPVCGLTEDVFISKGLLGCDQCYEAFSNRVEHLINSLQGNACHKGKTPKSMKTEPSISEIENASVQLVEAVKSERYEEAAIWRDRIKAIKEEALGNQGEN